MTRESRRMLEVLVRLNPGAAGLLYGRRLGPRHIIETCLALPSETPPSLEDLIEAERIDHRDLLGWFVTGDAKPSGDLILNPFMSGKLLIRIQAEPNGDLLFKPQVVEFRDTFTLRDIGWYAPECEELE